MANMCKAKMDIEYYDGCTIKGTVFSYDVDKDGIYKLSDGSMCTKEWFDNCFEIINENGEDNMNNNIEANTMKANETTNKKRGRKARRVMCIETNTIYNGVPAVASEMNLCDRSIYSMLKGEQRHVGGYHFAYVDENDNPIIAHEVHATEHEVILQKSAKMVAKGKSCNGNTDAVVNVTKAKAYTSCKDAAEDVGVSSGYMSVVCRSENGTAKGNRCFYVRDLPEHFEEVLNAFSKAVMYDELMTKKEKYEQLRNNLGEAECKVKCIEYDIERLHEQLKQAHLEVEKAKHDIIHFEW